MPSSVYINEAIDSVTVSSINAEGMFDVIVTSKRGISNTLRLTYEKILSEYGAYLTVADRQRMVLGIKKPCPKHKFCTIL